MGNPTKLLNLTRIVSLLTWGLDKVMKDKYRKEIKCHKSRWTVNRKSMKLLLNKSITIIDFIMRNKWGNPANRKSWNTRIWKTQKYMHRLLLFS